MLQGADERCPATTSVEAVVNLLSAFHQVPPVGFDGLEVACRSGDASVWIKDVPGSLGRQQILWVSSSAGPGVWLVAPRDALPALGMGRSFPLVHASIESCHRALLDVGSWSSAGTSGRGVHGWRKTFSDWAPLGVSPEQVRRLKAGFANRPATFDEWLRTGFTIAQTLVWAEHFPLASAAAYRDGGFTDALRALAWQDHPEGYRVQHQSAATLDRAGFGPDVVETFLYPAEQGAGLPSRLGLSGRDTDRAEDFVADRALMLHASVPALGRDDAWLCARASLGVAEVQALVRPGADGLDRDAVAALAALSG